MKTLSEIQSDIRALSTQLNQLAASIQYIRPDVIKSDRMDMKKIKYISQKYPITGHALYQYEDTIKQKYLMLLILTARIGQTEIEKSMLSISRIAYGAEYKGDLADIMRDTYTLSDGHLEEMVDTFFDDRIKMLLLLDMLLLSAEKKKKEVLQFISEISYLLGITEDEMRFLSNLTVVIMQQDLTCYVDYGVNSDVWGDVFTCYLKEFSFPYTLIKVPKNVLIGLGDMKYHVTLPIKEGTGILTEKGETICRIKDQGLDASSLEDSVERRLEKKMSDIKDEYKLCAQEKGKAYIFRNKVTKDNLIIGVITHPLNTKEKAYSWYTANK